MRFTLINNIQNDSAMSLILKGFLTFILLYLVADILVMYSSFGLTVDTLSTTLFGNEVEYIDPITKSAFLEFWHTQIFFMMMILITLNAIFVRMVKTGKVLMINTLMISAISSLVFLPLAFYMSELFVSLFIFSFFIWHGVALYMIAYSFWKLNAKSI